MVEAARFTRRAFLVLVLILVPASGGAMVPAHAEPLPDSTTVKNALAAGHLRLGDYSLRRAGARRLLFSRHANPARYWYGFLWFPAAIFLIWKVYRRIQENPGTWWRKLGWKLNAGIPVYVLACVIVTWSGARVIVDADLKLIKEETTWAGLGVNTLKESPLRHARSLRILTLTKAKHKKKGEAKFALAIEWDAGAKPTELFILKTKTASAVAARSLLGVMEVYVGETAGIRRFQK